MTTDIQAFDFSVNLLQAILWQYTNAPNLLSILESEQTWYDVNQTEFWTNWYDDVFNLKTANTFGLNVWAYILNQPIFVTNGPSPLTKPAWGFGSHRKNFNRGNFSSTTGSTYQLPDESARILLQLRYFQLTSAGCVPEINRMLKYVFADYGQVYLEDRLDMTQHYVFRFVPDSNLSYLLNNFDILPRPAGVKSSYYVSAIPRWGFGPYNANFTRGNFGA